MIIRTQTWSSNVIYKWFAYVIVVTIYGKLQYTTIRSEIVQESSGACVVELCTALGWDLDFPRLPSYVSCARPVGTDPYYQFPESREPSSRGRPAGLTLFRF